MHKPLYLSLFPILAVLTLVASSPTIRSSLQRRQGVNCTDPDAIASGSCWDTLHLADYLTDWNKNRPICKTTDGTLEDGAHCCAPNEVWSTCFIRLKLGNHGYNCININQGTCPNFDVDGNTAPEVRYILGTMYSELPLDSPPQIHAYSMHQVSTISSVTGTEPYHMPPFQPYLSTSLSSSKLIPFKRPTSSSKTFSLP